MVIVEGKIVDFLIHRNGNTGYAEFIFASDHMEDIPRFTAFCCGNIPDVVAGVPIKVEFEAESPGDILTVDLKRDIPDKITYEMKQSRMNRLLFVCINFRDETYARKLLKGIKGISDKTASKILDALDGDLSNLSGHWDDEEFWKGLRGSHKYINALREGIGSILEQDSLVKKYGRYGVGYPQAGIILSTYGKEAEDKLCGDPYRTLRTADVGFQAADNLAKDLGMSYLSKERLRSIIWNVLDNNECSGNTADRKSVV